MIRKILVALLSFMPHRIRLMFESYHYNRLLSDFDLGREPDLRIALQLIEPGATVIDVGASVGLWTLNFAKRVGATGQIVALEPVPTTFAILQKMVLGLANARAAVNMHNCALSDTCGQAAMKLPRDERGIRNHYCAKLAPNGDIPVSVETLDNICAAISGPIRFIKVDTEGHELSVIRGGLQTLRRHRPILCIEISTDPDDIASDGARLMSLLDELDYSCHVRRDGKLSVRKRGDISVNYFFLPNDHKIGAAAR